MVVGQGGFTRFHGPQSGKHLVVFTTISQTASWGVNGKQEGLSTYPPYIMPHSFIASTQMVLVLQSSVGLGVGASRGGSLAALVTISQNGISGGGSLQGLKQLFQTHF